MFKVTKDDEFVTVTVKLKRRVMAKDKKIYVYTRDAHRKATEAFPELKISQKADHTAVASSVREPHEVSWKFKIIQPHKPAEEVTRVSRRQRKALDELTQMTEEMGGYKMELSDSIGESPDLTDQNTSDTLVEAEEKAE